MKRSTASSDQDKVETIWHQMKKQNDSDHCLSIAANRIGVHQYCDAPVMPELADKDHRYERSG